MENRDYKYRVASLRNGITLVHIKKDKEYFTSFQLLFKVGSLLEPEGKKGISHFFEHLVFHGSKNYTKDKINELPLFYGGGNNAYTYYNETVYSLNVLSEYTIEALDLLLDMTFNLDFDSLDIEKERNIVLEELESDFDNHQNLPYYDMVKHLEEENMKYRVIGLKEDVKKVTKEDFKELYDKYYKPSNAVLFVLSSEDITTEELLKQMKKKLSKEKHESFDYINPNNKFTRDGFIKTEIPEDKITMSVVFNKVVLNEDKYVGSILSNMLTGYLGGAVTKELRENQTLCYAVSSSIQVDHTPSFHINFGDKTKISHIISEIKRILQESKTKFTDYDLQLAKNSTKSGILKSFQSSKLIMRSFMSKYMKGRNILDGNDMSRIIDNITLKDITYFIDKYFTDTDVLVSVATRNVDDVKVD